MWKAAAVQIHSRPAQVQDNRERALQLVEAAAKQGAKLVVLPELWHTGYHLPRETFCALAAADAEMLELMRAQAKKWGIVMVVPFAEQAGERLYNSLAVIEADGRMLGIYRKSFLWGKEKEIFVPGEKKYELFHTSLGPIGVLICYDIEFPEPSRLLTLQGAQLIVVPSVWSKQAEPRWDIQLPARALDNTVFVLGVNTVGEGSCGKSKALAPDGRLLAEASKEQEELLLAEIDWSAIEKVRREIPYLRDYDPVLQPGYRH
ncbi:nitrilase-related carbon-nitrogen hydrolase [Brevibacillus marinus]|jgi:predicted amidohydrolase|uniref:nitrilase-related carbon-nitrogen hydrolase n=1 Tax=Brevibacillus marinus TaxID=2496837 RepID=UPI000F844239|nr:nitrilase-related carbon-nitrogen hydrolase [Brevibacillus marinus]